MPATYSQGENFMLIYFVFEYFGREIFVREVFYIPYSIS